MLHLTRGIVFKCTDYSESSVVVQIFTEKFGLQSYLLNGVKKNRSKIRINSLQPLHLLEMVVYHKPIGTLQRVAELRQAPVFQTIPYDIVKSSIVLFLNEVLFKALKQQKTDDEQLFSFIFNAIDVLDKTEENLSLFHLHFLLHLTKFLGFYPDTGASDKCEYFDLKEGSFVKYSPAHPFVLYKPLTDFWDQLLSSRFDRLAEIKIPVTDRKILLKRILDYYRLHLEGFGEIKSHYILEEVLA